MYYNYNLTNNKLNDWKNILHDCQKEILNCNKKILIGWPEKHLYRKDMEWKIIPICYCIPSDDPKNMIWVESVEKFIPIIYKFVKSLNNVRTALISKMGKNVKLDNHQGWKCISNHVLRCHFPILVEQNKSGVIVSNHKKYHVLGDYILFDDSLIHCGFNESDDERYILIVDFKRPSTVDKGSSDIESSPELLKLANLYKIVNNVYNELSIMENKVSL